MGTDAVPAAGRRAGTAAVALGLALGLANGLGFAFHLGVSRVLAPSGYGLVGALVGLATIVNIPLAAVQIAITKVVAESPGASSSRRAVRSGLLAAAATGVVALAAAPLVAAVFRAELGPCAALAVALSATVAGVAPKGVLVGQRRAALVAGAVLGGGVARVALGVVAARLAGPTGAVLGFAAGDLVTAAILVVPAAASHEGPPLRVPLADAIASVAAYGGVWALATVDTVAIRHHHPGVVAGWYVAASTVGSAALHAPSALATGLLPLMVAGARRGRAFLVAAGGLLALQAAAGAALAVGAPLLLSLGFGEGFEGAAPLLRRLGPSYACLGALVLLLQHQYANGRRWVTLVWVPVLVLAAVVAADRPATSVAAAALVASAASAALALLGSVAVEVRRAAERAEATAG